MKAEHTIIITDQEKLDFKTRTIATSKESAWNHLRTADFSKGWATGLEKLVTDQKDLLARDTLALTEAEANLADHSSGKNVLTYEARTALKEKIRQLKEAVIGSNDAIATLEKSISDCARIVKHHRDAAAKDLDEANHASHFEVEITSTPKK